MSAKIKTNAKAPIQSEAGPADIRSYNQGPTYKLSVGLIHTYKHINEVNY